MPAQQALPAAMSAPPPAVYGAALRLAAAAPSANARVQTTLLGGRVPSAPLATAGHAQSAVAAAQEAAQAGAQGVRQPQGAPRAFGDEVLNTGHFAPVATDPLVATVTASQVQSGNAEVPIANSQCHNWLYPASEAKPVRGYQERVTETAMFDNTMVVLPTGLGKTFVAAVIMYNFYRYAVAVRFTCPALHLALFL